MLPENKRLIIVGASGHGRVVADIAKLNGYSDIVFLDDNTSVNSCGSYSVEGLTADLEKYDGLVFVAIGNASVRKKIMEKYSSRSFPTLVHPNAVVAEDNQVFISLPYGALVDRLVNMGCEFIDTPVDRRGVNPLRDLKLLKKYGDIISEVEPDLVITYTIKPNVYGGFVCRLKKVPYAVNITGLGTAFDRGGLLRKLVTFMYKVGLKKAKVVFFENSANQQLFINEKIVQENKTCLLNGAGVNLEHYSYAEYPHNDKTRFLFIGRVMKEKGIDELLDAMQRLVSENIDCFLDVVGPCEDDYEDTLRRFEQEGWLKYHGFQDDVRPFIKQCDCFVLPSWHEGMANTNLESAAMGRPVITSSIPGCMEAVEDGVSGFLCIPKNSNSLYVLMKSMVDMSRLEREAFGKMGRKYMENVFAKNYVVEKTVTALEQ